MNHEAEESVCLVNIGPKERAKRMGFAKKMSVVSAGTALALFMSKTPRLLRFGLFIPISLATFGYYQSKQHT